MTATFTAPIQRVDTAKGHHYKDANGLRVPGVTTILGGGLPKAALINWAATATAEYAIDNWEDLALMSPAKRLARLQKARYEERDAASNRGTEVHKLGERLVRGEEIEVPDELAGHVESYVQLLDAWQVDPVAIEITVAYYRHGYVGTLDLIADFPLGVPGYSQDCPRLLCDLKTNRSGIFGETALQLAAYRYADTYLSDDDGEQPMIEVDGCAAIHVRANGADLIPVTAGERQHRQFLYAQQIYEFDRESRDLVGAALDAPGSVPRRRLEVVA